MLSLALVGLGALTQGAGPAVAQGAPKGKFGDWDMRCETPAGASRDQCAIIQSVAADDKPNVNLVVIVLKTSDGKSRLLRVIAPLGVLLPAGLGLKIDDTASRKELLCDGRMTILDGDIERSCPPLRVLKIDVTTRINELLRDGLVPFTRRYVE
jgi:hypothetical protein